MKVRPLFGCLRKADERRRTHDPDNRWSNVYREREKNSIYKWVGMRSGGELITVYEKEGEDGVLTFAQEKVETMLYNEGQQPQLIKFADYVRWKKGVNMVFGVEDEEEHFNEAKSNFREHEAQWKLNKRGVEGETLVHLLLNREEPVCQEIARILVNKYPGLAKDIYLGEEMFGQCCLHLAIVHDDYDTVQLLLENGASVNARATGDFFMPEDWQEQDIKTMDYQGYAYYGEYPLAFAACFENKDIYDLLIQFGANPDLQDMFGNTVLHMCVINNKNAMYSYAVRHWHKPAHTSVVNHSGYTPLTLATKLGRRQIFDEMLELMKVEFWRFSDMTCSAYPLDALDTVRPDGSTNYDSALMTVINGSTNEHLEMIGSEVIQRLLADKWNAFAKRKLIVRFVLLTLHLICICFAAYLHPEDAERLYLVDPDWVDLVRLVFESLTILNCCYFVFIQQIGELRTQGLYGYLGTLKNAPAKVVYLGANLCLLACVPARLTHSIVLEEGLLSFAIPGCWLFLLFFARSAKLTGPFVQMIYSMIGGDMVRFGIISLIFLVSFSEAFYFLSKDMTAKQGLQPNDPNFCQADHRIQNYDSLLDTSMTLFRICMNGMDYEEFSCSNYEPLTKTLFVIFMFIMPIMMTNILIAMMGNTYSQIISQAEKAWRQQHAQIVMVLERSMDKAKLAAFQLDYSIRMNEPGRETRGLMVIKQTTKTRANQRKQAIANWKSIGRKVITMAKELGMESTKFLLHSHDRLVTDETVGGGGGSNASGIISKASFGTMRPNSMAGTSSPGSQRVVNRLLLHQVEDGGGGAGEERRMGEEEEDDPRQGQRQNEAGALLRRLSIPNPQYASQLGGGNNPHHLRRQIMLDPSALRQVVTHATVNSVKLKQMKAQKQVLMAGLGHRKLANGNILPGVVDAARRLLASSGASRRLFSGAGAEAAERVSASEVHLQRNNNAAAASADDQHHDQQQMAAQHVHLTQRQLLAAAGSLVRGVEMLPSVDVPNIPASETTTGTRKTSERGLNVVPISPPVMADDGGGRLLLRQGGGAQIEMTENVLPHGGPGPFRGPRANVRADLFRKKDSPSGSISQPANKVSGVRRMKKSSSMSSGVSLSPSASAHTSSAGSGGTNDKASRSTTGSSSREN